MRDVAELRQLVVAGESAKRLHKAVWYQNVAFFKGAQYHRWADLANLFIYTQKDPAWRVRRVVNYWRAIALVIASKLTQNRPSWTVVPATLEEDDRQKARLGQYLLDWVWEKNGLQAKLFLAVLWSVITGNGFWQIYWDGKAGADVLEQDLATGKLKNIGPSGDVLVEVLAPFDVGLDPLVDDITRCEWGYRKRWCSAEWVKQTFGVKVSASEAVAGGSGADAAMNRKAYARLLTDPEGAAEFGKRYLNVFDYYDINKGKLFYFTDTRMLGQQDWDGPLPFIHFRALPNLGDLEYSEIGSGGVWGETTMTDGVPLQQQLNKLDSQAEEIKNAIAYPKLLVSRGAKVDMLENVGVPGGLVHWSGTGPTPSPLYMGSLPAWMFQMRRDIKESLQDVCGAHEVSQGEAPGSIQSGVGVQFLAELDATRWGPQARNISEAVREGGRRILGYFKDYAPAAVKLNAIGASGEMEVAAFDAGSLTSTDVRIQEGSTFALSKSLRNSQAIEMWDKGIIKDEREIKRITEFGTLEEAMGNINQDAMRARRENARLKLGQPVRLEDFDVDVAHLENHDEYMKSSTFEKDSTEVQEAFRQHRAAHAARMQQALMAQQQAATQRGIASAGRPEMPMPMPPMMGQQQGGGMMSSAMPAGGPPVPN